MSASLVVTASKIRVFSGRNATRKIIHNHWNALVVLFTVNWTLFGKRERGENIKKKAKKLNW